MFSVGCLQHQILYVITQPPENNKTCCDYQRNHVTRRRNGQRVSANPNENGDLVPAQRPDGATGLGSQRTRGLEKSVSLEKSPAQHNE